MSYEEKMERIRQLALLCLETRELTDDELNAIIQNSDEVYRFLERCRRFASTGASRLKRYKLRKVELEKLSTEELEVKMNDINSTRARILADDTDDDLPDSFFEAPPIDSDQHILYEILEERKKQKVVIQS